MEYEYVPAHTVTHRTSPSARTMQILPEFCVREEGSYERECCCEGSPSSTISIFLCVFARGVPQET